jgi:hypothetical protein
MQVIIKSFVEHRKSKRPLPKRGTTEYCAVMEDAADAALSVLNGARGLRDGRSERLAQVRQDPNLAPCTKGLSVFGFGTAPLTAATPIRQASEPEVTGAYELYLDPMDAAIQGSDGSVASVQSRVDAVLAQAVSASIPDGDLLALASFASLVQSSAAEWNAFDWGGGGSGCGTSDGCYLMSVFRFRAGDKVRNVLGADLAGCLAGVKGWGALRLLLFAPAWEALAGACGVRGTIASGVALFLL